MKHEKLVIIVGSSLLSVIMVVIAALGGFAVCSEPLQDGSFLQYNAACLCFGVGDSQQYWPVIIWCVLMLLFAIPTLTFVVMIAINRLKGRYHHHRD